MCTIYYPLHSFMDLGYINHNYQSNYTWLLNQIIHTWGKHKNPVEIDRAKCNTPPLITSESTLELQILPESVTGLWKVISRVADVNTIMYRFSSFPCIIYAIIYMSLIIQNYFRTLKILMNYCYGNFNLFWWMFKDL